MNQVLTFFSTYLIEIMSCFLIIGLGFRFASYRSSKKDDSFFSSFVNEAEKVLTKYKDNNEKIEDVDLFIENLLDDVKEKLPTRAIRGRSRSKKNKAPKNARNIVSLREFVKGDQGLFLGLKSEGTTFKSKYPPNFNELADRVLEHDPHWNYLASIFPIAPISRLIDILPGLFVVFGIFGTFIGIGQALPEIAKIDFNNLEASGAILTRFVLNVTFAMKTSIAGILFSLITTLLNTLAPVRGIRQKTYKKISNCFENIWYAIHGEKSLEQEVHSIFPKLLKTLERIESKLEKSDSLKKVG